MRSGEEKERKEGEGKRRKGGGRERGEGTREGGRQGGERKGREEVEEERRRRGRGGKKRRGKGRRREEETEKRRCFPILWSQNFFTLLKITEDFKKLLFVCITSSDYTAEVKAEKFSKYRFKATTSPIPSK